MIKAEVVFDGDDIRVNNYRISETGGHFLIFNSLGSMVKEMYKELYSLEEAIQYCMEN